jgi:hypothetical protein
MIARVGSRAFGGFTYRDRIEIGFYGELSRAVNDAGAELRILHVDRNLARLPGFTEALARFGGPLGQLEHPRVVSTRTLGRTPEGVLVVATAAVDRPVSVDRLLEAGPPPAEVALALGLAVAEALAAAHGAGLVHGRIHPRSLLVSAAGAAQVDHFGPGRALAQSAARAGDADPTGSFHGYLAPELTQGGAPSVAADVFAAGALLYALYGGDPQGGAQAGRIRATTTLRRAISRAMDPVAAQRFAGGAELREALAQAAAADGAQPAPAAAIARWLAETRVRVGDEADVDDSGVDDLIAALPGATSTPTPVPARASGGAADLDGLLDELAQDTAHGQAAAARAGRAAADDELITAVQEEPSDVGDSSGLTHVDDPPDAGRDPISELIALGDVPVAAQDRPSARLRLDSSDDDEQTPLPPPTPHGDGTFTKQGDDVLAGTGRRRILERAAEEAIAELEDEADRDRKKVVRLPSQPTEHVPIKGGIPGWVWLLITLAALGGMFWLVYTKTDIFHPERARARDRQKDAERRAEEVRKRSEQKRGASITVDVNEPAASVWLLLGKTPSTGVLETIPLPAHQPNYLRIERADHQAIEYPVLARHWSGDSALITVSLKAAAKPEPLPAYPPEPPAGDKDGFSGDGLGVLRVETRPGLADVWLLVGYSGGDKPVMLTDFPAGIRYEFRGLKKGFPEARASIEADAWPDHGSLEPGAMKREITVPLEFAKPQQP